jgi:hypothetical protein
MAFAASKFSNIAIGPCNVYTYHTADTLVTASRNSTFNTTNSPGLRKGDFILAVHTDNDGKSQVMNFAIRDVDATYSTCCVMAGTAMAY